MNSMDVEVIRTAMDWMNRGHHHDAFLDAMQRSRNRGFEIGVHVILGLPGETLDTWKKNFWSLYEMGNHTGLTVFQAQLLENAEMNLLQKKLFKITSQPVTDYFSGSYSNEHVEESIDIITGTKDMPFEQMLDASIFSWFQNTFHINGISTLLSRLVHKYSDISYSKFYADLFEHMQGHEWLKNEQDQVRQYY